MIVPFLRRLARELGCREDQAEDVLRSEASARATLSRRALLGAGAAAVGAVAGGNLLSRGGLSVARWPSLLSNFDDILKRSYPAPRTLYMDPATYAALRKVVLGDPALVTGPDPLETRAIVVDKYCPNGRIFDAPSLDAFRFKI